jgi:IS30 family transposase
VWGRGSPDCLLTMVERATGYTLIGKLADRTVEALNPRAIRLLQAQPRRVRTITADNGTEMTGYRVIEQRTGTRFFFALPYHAWQRGTNENTNGLIRQYVPKGESMAGLTQRDCAVIARKLNTRPRKRLGYRTPEECYVP